MNSSYSEKDLVALYELGRLYYEMGYFAPAERVFAGLIVIDGGITPARVGLGLVKLERGLFSDAMTHFRMALQSGCFKVSAYLGLCCSFVAGGELDRARSLLSQLEREKQLQEDFSPEHKAIRDALQMRCE